MVPPDIVFNSPVIHYDTTRTSGSGNEGTYDPRYGQHVDIEGLRIFADQYPDKDQSGSIGVHLDARGSYIQFNRITGRIKGLATQVQGTTTDAVVVDNGGNKLQGYVNGCVIEVDFRNATDTFVRHAGDHRMRSSIKGVMQPGLQTNYGLVNETPKDKSLHFRGQIWDTGKFENAATKGARITVELENNLTIPASEFNENSAEETTTNVGQTPGFGWFYRNGNGNMVSMRADDKYARLYTDNTESLRMYRTGGVAPPRLDLSTKEPTGLDHGVMYSHDGSNAIDTPSGTSSKPGIYVWDQVNDVFVPVAQVPSQG